MNTTKDKQAPATRKVPVYEVRLVQARKALRLAEDTIGDSHAAARALHALIGLTDREHFACLFVNCQQRVTGAHIVAIGGQQAISGLDVRGLLRAALAACAAGLVLSHNHPSGLASPSQEDITTTARIMRAANIIGIPVLDHVIVTRDAFVYHSMLNRGTLPSVPSEG
jgi:DNA repair protein RadC